MFLFGLTRFTRNNIAFRLSSIIASTSSATSISSSITGQSSAIAAVGREARRGSAYKTRPSGNSLPVTKVSTLLHMMACTYKHTHAYWCTERCPHNTHSVVIRTPPLDPAMWICMFHFRSLWDYYNRWEVVDALMSSSVSLFVLWQLVISPTAVCSSRKWWTTARKWKTRS